MLTDECDIPTGEALFVEKDHTVSSKNMQEDIYESDKNEPWEISSLKQNVSLEAPTSIEKRPSKFVPFVSNQQVLKSGSQGSASKTLYSVSFATLITTVDEELGPDKSKVQVNPGIKTHTAASLKSIRILSKFWGDEVEDEPATDRTMEIDTDSEQYLAKHTHITVQARSGRKSKKRKCPKIQASNGSVL